MEATKDFKLLKKNLKKDFSGLKHVRVALLGDTATQFLTHALRASGYDRDLDLQIWEADFSQIERQVYDAGSELYEFNPEIVIIYQSSHKLLSRYNKLPQEARASLAATELSQIQQMWTELQKGLNADVIFFNYNEINDAVFGNFANKVESSFLFQLRKLNYELMNFATGQPGFHVLDLSSLQNRFGKSALFNTSVYVNAEMTLSPDVLPQVGALALDLIGALRGQFKKCVILDLDNTLWGGIIGDDGLEKIQVGTLGIGKAFSEFQYWLKKLKQRGIILAVCSKNTESIAKEPFEKHPEMPLHLEDIAVFIANWENKVDNIRQIQSILNIGFDSMVFLDDNPFERNIVRESIPSLTIPELPEDPAEYLEYLYSLNLFETAVFSELDAERTKQYQVEAQRTRDLQSFSNEKDFLQSLNMRSLVEPFNKFNTPRVSQLSQRSNQFNLRTVRYNIPELEAMAGDDSYLTFSFTLEDKFGDNGLICVVVLKKETADTAFIESWFMSCRVLKRGMEDFVLNTIAAAASSRGFKYLKGEYLPTAKNVLVEKHYEKLEFTKSGGYWLLDLQAYASRPCFISQIEKGI